MNLIEIAEDLKDLPDQYLMQEIQQPTGNFPSYLIVSELGRRKRMRDKVAKEMPSQTVAQELSTPPQPQMPQQMPQGMAPQGLMAMPQAQTELAAQDAMGTTPPEMMMPQMASGGIVSFRDGGDVIRAANGFPEDMFLGTPPADNVQGLSDLIDLQKQTERDKLISTMTLPELQEFNSTGKLPERLRTAPVSPPAGVPPPAAPAGAPPAPPAPPPSRDIRSAFAMPPPVTIPERQSDYAIQTARAQKISDYEQAVPDRLTPFLQEAITKREGDIEGRRGSNINEALIQPGLGMMGTKSPNFLQGISEGGMGGLKVYREGAKDIRQSEEALLSARAKMMESQSLRDQNKFKLADEVDKQAREDYKTGIELARTQSAIALQDMQARIAAEKAPAEIAESEARAFAYRNPSTKTKLQVPDPILLNRVKSQALSVLRVTEDEYKNNPTKRAEVDKAIADALSEQGFSYPNVSIAPTRREIEYPG